MGGCGERGASTRGREIMTGYTYNTMRGGETRGYIRNGGHGENGVYERFMR